MALCVLAMLLLVIPACLSQQDLENKVFVFPKETSTDHVLLRPKLTEPLEKVSVCLRSFTKLSRPYSLFSLATPGKDNALLIFLSPSSTYVYINQMETLFRTAPDTLDWQHTCATWDSNTGQVQLWVNGKLYTGGVSSKGSSISTEASVILGQEQDTWGGGFESPQSFVGEMSDVHMWDYVLTPEDIKKVISGHHHGNVINWKSLEYEIKGDVLVKPKVWHMEGKMFVFPKDTSTAHILLRPTMTNPLRKVSVCLYSYSELSLFYSLFTIATPEVADTIFIGFDPQSSRYYVYKNRTVNYFILQGSQPLDWRHTCVTWDTDTGVVQLWVNEKFYQGDVSMKASSIEPSSSIVLGKNDDLIGFGSPRSFVGEISDVHMWDYVLSPEDIQKVISGDLHGNVINWRSLICEIKGEALVKPKALYMDRKVFLFPKETSTAHVLLRPPLADPLQKFSVCLRSYTDLSRSYSLFSLATPGKDNAFLIFLQPPNTYSVYINQEVIVFKTDPESLEWRHTCVTWDSVTGVVQLWVKGKRYPRKVCNKGSSIAAEASIVLGQEQDSFAGGFEAPQSFVGEICDVNMWDYVLTQGDIQNALYGYIQGNIINWKSLPLQMKGDVLIQPRD